MSPSLLPTVCPSVRPTRVPSPVPTSFPVIGSPTRSPTIPQPSRSPTKTPTTSPTMQPVLRPSFVPSFAPTEPERVLLQVTQTFQGIDTNNFNENAKTSLKDAIAKTLGCPASSVTIVSVSPTRRVLYNNHNNDDDGRKLSSSATIVYTVNIIVVPGQTSTSTYNQAIAVMSNPTTLSNNLVSQGFSSITVQPATVSNISPTHQPTLIPTQTTTTTTTITTDSNNNKGVDITSMIIGFVIIIPIVLLLILKGKFCMSSIEYVMKYAKNDIQNSVTTSLQEESKIDPDDDNNNDDDDDDVYELHNRYKPKTSSSSSYSSSIKGSISIKGSKSSRVVPLLEPPDAITKYQNITSIKRVTLPAITSTSIIRTSSSPIRSPSKSLSSSSSSSIVVVDPVHTLPSDIHIVKAMIANSSKGHRNTTTTTTTTTTTSNNNNNNNSNSISSNSNSNRQKRLLPMPIREY